MVGSARDNAANGAVVWVTGLPSSGKSYFGRQLHERLKREPLASCLLDGDRVRELLHPRLGYSDSERDDFYLTLGDLALELAEQGLLVVVPATAHLRIYRDRVRARCPRFVEVYVSASLEQCRERDTKGLYAGFAEGRARGIPGEDLPYEAPLQPELTVSRADDEAALRAVLSLLRG